MTLSESELFQILKMVEESNFGELRLEAGDLKLVVRKKGYNPVAEGAPAAASKPVTVEVQQPSLPDPPRQRNQQEEKSKKTATDQEGTVAIESPMLGTIYLRPSPDAPSYAEVGSFVKEDDTVCLIEVMKVFTAVKAGVRGYIIQILVETNEMVERNQPLFLVKPATERKKRDT